MSLQVEASEEKPKIEISKKIEGSQSPLEIEPIESVLEPAKNDEN
jgi:hypothetical protein